LIKESCQSSSSSSSSETHPKVDNLILDTPFQSKKMLVINNQLNTLKETWKHLASWDNTKHSLLALVGINVLCLYLKYTDATALNLSLYAILTSYVWIEYGQWLWKAAKQQYAHFRGIEATIEEEEETISESVSEISFMIEETKSKFSALKKFRSETPGLFSTCLFSFFYVLSSIAPYLTLLPCIWMTLMSGLLLPLGLRKLKDRSPEISDASKKIQNMFIVILEDLYKKANVQIRKGMLFAKEKGKEGLKVAEDRTVKVKAVILQYNKKAEVNKIEEKSSTKEGIGSSSAEKVELTCIQKGVEPSQIKDINGNIEAA